MSYFVAMIKLVTVIINAQIAKKNTRKEKNGYIALCAKPKLTVRATTNTFQVYYKASFSTMHN